MCASRLVCEPSVCEPSSVRAVSVPRQRTRPCRCGHPDPCSARACVRAQGFVGACGVAARAQRAARHAAANREVQRRWSASSTSSCSTSTTSSTPTTTSAGTPRDVTSKGEVETVKPDKTLRERKRATATATAPPSIPAAARTPSTTSRRMSVCTQRWQLPCKTVGVPIIEEQKRLLMQEFGYKEGHNEMMEAERMKYIQAIGHHATPGPSTTTSMSTSLSPTSASSGPGKDVKNKFEMKARQLTRRVSDGDARRNLTTQATRWS